MSSLFIHTDVTVVKLYNNNILTGIGSSTSIYSKDSFEFLDRVCCLNGQKIYGFVPLFESGHILVFGGKQFTVISLDYIQEGHNSKTKLRRLFEPVVCDDWLHSAVWLTENVIALLTAHNCVQIWNTTTQSMTKQYLNEENSILYSGLILPLADGMVVLAGTVFSEIIVHIPGEDKSLHYLKGHRGVIFSVSCYPAKNVIVSTSDDRSVRVWEIVPIGSPPKPAYHTIQYWRNANIVCKHEVYGHSARVMRSCITDNFIISVGEDSALCFWDYEGKLLRKNVTHQNSGIWSVDADRTDVVTGGGDGAVILHPLTMALEYGHQESLILQSENPVPKKVAFTARRNLVVLDESEDVIHYVNVHNKMTEIHRLNHGTTNKFLSLSSCKQLIAVSNMSGKLDVFVENCKDEECIRNIVSTALNLHTVLSMQWVGNRHIVFCSGSGVITVFCSNEAEVKIYAEFTLPHCKERWLTAAALDSNNNFLIVGDRCGSVHVFAQGNMQPVKTFNKVHGRYGPTSITIKQGGFITTGRDGTVKYFSLDLNEKSLAKLMNSKDLEFQWVEKFIDRDQNVVCGFKERVFVIYNVKNNSKLVEVPCGGGHRTWDVLRYIEKVNGEFEECVKLVYVKNNDIFTHTFQMSKVISRNVINSTHSKEINCLKSFKSDVHESVTYFISGGEDTTLRISSLSSEQVFQDEIVFKHLSNVRTLKTFEEGDKIVVVSAGGRAQICIKLINFETRMKQTQCSSRELVNYLIKGTDKQRKNNQTWKDFTIDFDPETRIMDLDLLKLDDGKFLIFAGCSDAFLRVFLFDIKGETFEAVADLQHHKTCILKTTCFKFAEKNILITCTTRGEISFWDVTDIADWNTHKPFLTTTSNKCGINSVDVICTSDNSFLVVTGGDDNAIHLNAFEAPNVDLTSVYVKHSWFTDKFHCSQITGTRFVGDILLSASIDQRVTMAKWRVAEDGVRCDYATQTYCDIADIQGMEVLSHSCDAITVCVFGKGLEVVRLDAAGANH